ncbi:MAG: hypothetical protein LUM44_12480 [Pyrinomonadaceae bacterium]|nr:hypothetical protein [Pyrinomonadaceae bacterium]
MEVTLNLPENIYRNISELAEKKHRRVEEVIADKLRDDFLAETSDYAKTVASWSDEDVLALAKLKLPKEQANRMSELSDLKQRGLINAVEKSELEMYLEIYNNANLRKADGIAEAVKRGLVSSLDNLL